jgi:hypothetical protein
MPVIKSTEAEHEQKKKNKIYILKALKSQMKADKYK